MNKSIATINSPEFINLEPLEINPLMSACQIKVLYVGENRNQTYISKEVATEMAKTLRGAPIVGYYREEKEDFCDHGNQVVIDDEGVKFKCLTKPYGFVSPNAKVWFQEFEDTNEFGESVIHEYLMTTGYLWTGQFEECKSILDGEGKPQSMELDNDSMSGQWKTNSKTGIDFFIINDATFSKLCILGEDVEPCFEGANITSFSKVDNNFKKTLFTMMQDLQFALKGGETMEEETTPIVDTTAEEAAAPIEEIIEAPVAAAEENSVLSEEPVEEEIAESEEEVPAEGAEEENAPVVDENAEKFALLESENIELHNRILEIEKQYEELCNKYEAMNNENNTLKAFKAAVENAEKDAMIEKFSMLSEEDKADVIQNKSNYTLDEIESKLSVICVRKKVNLDSFAKEKNNNNMNGKVFTYNMEISEDNVPAWVQAVRNNKR